MMNTITMLYYLDAAQQVQGPCTVRQINELRKQGVLNWQSPVAEAGADEWVEMSTYGELIEPTQPTPISTTAPTAAEIAAAVATAQGKALGSAGTKTALAGVAVSLVNPIGGAAMIAAGLGMKNAGDKLKRK